ncbi:hypothetical protein O3Q51_12085 [Cryomorphaceae bacterium 1068]|nr:hypothetical protein [Cryomorphaceae bacterium 1068]
MEKSIENIWKEGFLKGEALVAPKVNDLYNRKSVHIIDKFMRMFRKNIWAIIIAAVIILLTSFMAGALLAGAIVSIMLMYIAYTAKFEMDALAKVDKGQNSYSYLKSFQDWLNQSIERYGKMYRVVYPALILCFYFGIWFSDIFGEMRQKVAESSDNLIFGMHVPTTVTMIIAALTMAFFAKTIHREDVKFIYGGILKKLDEAMTEMDELRKEG